MYDATMTVKEYRQEPTAAKNYRENKEANYIPPRL